MPKYKPCKKDSRISDAQADLKDLKTLPSISQVVQRVKTLQRQRNGKSKQSIIISVSDEIVSCWRKQDVPAQKVSSVVNKLKRLMAKVRGNICTLFQRFCSNI